MVGEDPELSYYRSVEDLFASLRGTPHILSPRDFQLLRSWWRDEVPLAAVATGLTEVFARNREHENADPVVSLSYCRHAVKRHAKRIAEMHIGRAGSDHGKEPAAPSGDCNHLVADLTAVTGAQRDDRPAIAKVIARITEQVEMAGRDLPTEMLDEHFFGLESAMFHDCWQALSEKERQGINDRVHDAVTSTSATEEARQRSARALRDREIRLLLGLPRLELGQ